MQKLLNRQKSILNLLAEKDDAIQEAIDWQNKQASQNISYQELADKQAYFRELAERFDLTDEFLENGLI